MFQTLTTVVIPFINWGERETRIDWARDGTETSATTVFKAMLATSRCWSFPFSNLSQSLFVISTTRVSLTFFTNGARLKFELTKEIKRKGQELEIEYHTNTLINLTDSISLIVFLHTCIQNTFLLKKKTG